MDAGLVPEGGVSLHHHGGFGDQQPRDVSRFGASAGEGSHQHPVGQLQRTDRQGGEQVVHRAEIGRGEWGCPGPEGIVKVLTAQLPELEADAVVWRRVFSEVPPRVEYGLTERGLALLPVLDGLHAWGAAAPPGVEAGE